MADLWQSATRRVASRNTRLSVVAAGDCPGRSLDRYIGPLLEAAGPLRGRFIDVCGWDGSLAAVAASADDAVGVCNSHLIGSVRSARANLKGTSCEVRPAFGIEPAQTERFDVAFIRAPYWLGNRAVRTLVHAALLSLQEGGEVYLAGERSRGFDTFARLFDDAFGGFERVVVPGRIKVVRARRTTRQLTQGPIFASEFGEYGAMVNGWELRVARHPAVFADGRVDDATRMLIDCLHESTGRQLDLGCGSGLLAAAMARMSPESRIMAVDSNVAAVEVCTRTAELNGLTNVSVRPSYFGEELRSESFDVIGCYPPFHVGPSVSHDAARRLIREAARLLKSTGEFVVVQSSAQSHEGVLRKWFGQVREMARSRSHRVYSCSHPPAD
ncbi:MAG: methyltransferase [Chloroflexi bacterium]|nr:methyltransferase [Chloroflexota bacterium]MCY3938871.1 methyltransferase [Chloroflexota bacterium]